MADIRLRLFGEASIQIGEEVIGPEASHLFGLLLLLTLAPADGISRQELRELLFGRTEERAAAQRLRQLLYRLRQLGVELRETVGGAIRVGNSVVDVVEAEGPECGPLRALPHYRPRLPKAFLAWLDQTRERLERRAQTQLVRELREAHRRQDWPRASGLATVVLAADPLNEEVAAVGVESRAMLGQRDQALEIADRFVREAEADEPAAAAMRKLRARIARTSCVRRETTVYGREECFTFLMEQWERAAAGGGRISRVFGPPGMGKSRAAEAFSQKIRLCGGRVVSYRCDHQASQYPLSLFLAIAPELQTIPGSLGVTPETQSALRRLLPGATPTGEALPGPAEMSARRAELQRALIDLLEAISSERQLLIVIDDAHLLDEASHEVLRCLADQTNSAAVLVAAFSRPRSDGTSSLSTARRVASYVLPRLSDDDARRLLRELRNGNAMNDEQAVWTLMQAHGNPYYLHALAGGSFQRLTLPAQVTSLATNSYFSLSPNGKNVLETCLLLDTLASVKRVVQVANLNDKQFVAALRELEELDLVRYDNGRLDGPHAILSEAIKQLVPRGVAAILHARIAERLTNECKTGSYDMSLAWAAVQGWLAAGEPRAAISLACSCAREAAAIGESNSGIELLARIQREHLPHESRRELLVHLSDIAYAANRPDIVGYSLRERLNLAHALQEGPQGIADVTLKLIANETRRYGEYADADTILVGYLSDSSLSATSRATAMKSLMALADRQFDGEIALTAFQYLQDIRGSTPDSDDQLASAELIFHTTFGDPALAHTIARRAGTAGRSLLTEQPANSLRSNAGLALIRLGQYAEARNMAVETYRDALQFGALGLAEHAISIIADAEICLGNFSSAESWVQKSTSLDSESDLLRPTAHAGHYSALAQIALHFGRFALAERLLTSYSMIPGYFNCPRHRSATLAYSLLLKFRRGDSSLPLSIVDEITRLYERGRGMGAQDTIVEALWCAARKNGQVEYASTLLRDYLTVYRRERGVPEWNLRITTAEDVAWAV